MNRDGGLPKTGKGQLAWLEKTVIGFFLTSPAKTELQVAIRRWDYLVFGFRWIGLLDDASVNVRHRDIVSA